MVDPQVQFVFEVEEVLLHEEDVSDSSCIRYFKTPQCKIWALQRCLLLLQSCHGLLMFAARPLQSHAVVREWFAPFVVKHLLRSSLLGELGFDCHCVLWFWYVGASYPSLCAGEPSILSENVVDVQTLPFLWFGGSVMHYGLPFLQDRSLGDIQDC